MRAVSRRREPHPGTVELLPSECCHRLARCRSSHSEARRFAAATWDSVISDWRTAVLTSAGAPAASASLCQVRAATKSRGRPFPFQYMSAIVARTFASSALVSVGESVGGSAGRFMPMKFSYNQPCISPYDILLNTISAGECMPERILGIRVAFFGSLEQRLHPRCVRRGGGIESRSSAGVSSVRWRERARRR